MGKSLNENERAFKNSDVWQYYDCLSLWENFFETSVNSDYSGKTEKEKESIIFMLFFPINVYKESKWDNDYVKWEQIRKEAVSGDEKKRTEFVNKMKNMIFKGHPERNFLKHNRIKGTGATSGDSYRKKYCQIIEKNYEKELSRVIESLHLLNLNSNRAGEIIKKYFLDGDYFKILNKMALPYEDSGITYNGIIEDMLIAYEDKGVLLAKFIICLGLGEQVINCIDFIFSVDRNVRNSFDHYRNQIAVHFEQADYKGMYELLNKIDSHFFMDFDKIDFSNKKSIDLYYVAILYAEGIKLDTYVILEKNEVIARNAYIRCIKLFIHEDYNAENVTHIGNALYWLVSNNSFLFDDEIIRKYGKNDIEILEKAANYGSAEAALFLGKKYEFGDLVNHINVNKEKALEIYKKVGKTIARVSAVRVIRKLIEEEPQKYQKYEDYLKEAADLYVEEAIAVINKYAKEKNDDREFVGRNNIKAYYFVIGKNEENDYFIQSLDNSYNVFIFDDAIDTSLGQLQDEKLSKNRNLFNTDQLETVLGEQISYFNDEILDNLDRIAANVFFVALGSDQQKNLKYVVSIFDMCIRRYLHLKSIIKNDAVLSFLSNNVKIAVNLNKNESAIYLDRLQSMCEGVYIPIRYISYYEEASYDLLWNKAPLFSFKMKEKSESHHNRFVVLTDSMEIIPLINNMLSVMYYGDINQTYDLKILGPAAKKIESYLKIYESTLFDTSNPVYDRFNKIQCIEVSFGESILWDWDLLESDGITKKYSVAGRVIKNADYIVCGLLDHVENIRIAELIREKEIRNLTQLYNPNYSNTCQIACLCKNNNLVKETRGFFVNGQYVRYPWHSSYNLVGFGDISSMYSFDNVFGSFVDRLALKMHEAYYAKDDGSVDSTAAAYDYYSSQYSMDSSKVNALYTIYLMYTVGLFKNMREWNVEEVEKNIDTYAGAFQSIDNNKIVELAKKQHAQWTMYMKTRGYSCATVEQVRNYMSNGNPKHHSIKVAKLHPYMVPWEKLGDTSEAFSKEYAYVLERRLKETEAAFNSYSVCSESDIIACLNVWAINGTRKIGRYAESAPNTVYVSVLRKIGNILNSTEIECSERKNNMVKETEESYTQLIEELSGHVEKYICNMYRGFTFDNHHEKHLTLDDAKNELTEIISHYSWLTQVKVFKKGKDITDLRHGIMSLYQNYYQNIVWENDFIMAFWDNIKDLISILNKSELGKDIDIIKQIIKEKDDELKIDLEKEVIKNILTEVKGLRDNINLAAVICDYADTPEEMNMYLKKRALIEEYAKNGKYQQAEIQKIKEDGIEFALINLILLYQYQIEASVNKCIILYENLIHILNDLISYRKAQATGLQFEMDQLMEELNLPPLGSIKEKGIRMIKAIPDNYRRLALELGETRGKQYPSD